MRVLKMATNENKDQLEEQEENKEEEEEEEDLTPQEPRQAQRTTSSPELRRLPYAASMSRIKKQLFEPDIVNAPEEERSTSIAQKSHLDVDDDTSVEIKNPPRIPYEMQPYFKRLQYDADGRATLFDRILAYREKKGMSPFLHPLTVDDFMRNWLQEVGFGSGDFLKVVSWLRKYYECLYADRNNLPPGERRAFVLANQIWHYVKEESGDQRQNREHDVTRSEKGEELNIGGHRKRSREDNFARIEKRKEPITAGDRKRQRDDRQQHIEHINYKSEKGKEPIGHDDTLRTDSEATQGVNVDTAMQILETIRDFYAVNGISPAKDSKALNDIVNFLAIEVPLSERVKMIDSMRQDYENIKAGVSLGPSVFSDQRVLNLANSVWGEKSDCRTDLIAPEPFSDESSESRDFEASEDS